MPYLIPARTPLTPEEVDRAFDYLLALQMGGGNYASGRTPATPELAFLLLRLAENIVFPVTGVLGDGEPHADSFPGTRSGASCCPPCGTGRATPPLRPCWASPAASSASSRTSSPTPTTTETPAPPWRPCATNTWSGPAPCSP